MSEICYLPRSESKKIIDRKPVDFDGLKTILSKPTLGEKNGRSWMPVSMNGDTRKGEAVTAIHFLVLDVERKTSTVKDANGNPLLDEYGDAVKEVLPDAIEPPSIDQMLEKLATRQFKAIIHTSYSHSLEHPRYRLVFELSRPLAKDEVKPLGVAIASTLELDASSYDQGALEPARLFYLPRCPSKERLDLFRCEMSDGQPLDVDAMLPKPLPSGGFFDGVNTQVNSYEYTTPANGLNSNEHEQRINDLADALEFISSDDYDEWVRIGQCLHGLGADGFRLWAAWSQSSQKFDHTEAVSKWATFTGDNAGYQGVFSAAQAQGWTNSATLRKESRKVSTRTLQNTLQTPEPLLDDIAQPTPFPVDELPPLMRDAVKSIADFSQAPIGLAGQAVLGAAAYLAQTRTNAWSHISGKMPCSLFLLALGNSGEGKSAVHGVAFNPIEQSEKRERKAYASEIKALREMSASLHGKKLKEFEDSNPAPADPRTIISSDGSVSRIMSLFVDGIPSLFWSTDEGGQMLGGHSLKADNYVAVLGTLTNLWSKGEGERLRSRDNADSSGTFYNKRLSLSLMAQEVAIKSVLSDVVMREQGFLPRFIFSAPKSLVGTRILTKERMNQRPEHFKGITDYWQRIEELMQLPDAVEDGEVKASCMMPSNDAKDAWLTFRNNVETAQGAEGNYSELKPFASRAAENALRVATVIAFFEKKLEVDFEAMLSAIAICTHSLREWKRYTEASLLDADAVLAQIAIDWLIDKAKAGKWREFTADQWGKSGCNTRNLRSAKVRDKVFSLLVEKHYLLTTDAKQYKINPLLLAETADIAETF